MVERLGKRRRAGGERSDVMVGRGRRGGDMGRAVGGNPEGVQGRGGDTSPHSYCSPHCP